MILLVSAVINMISVLAAVFFDRSCEIFNHAVVDEYHAV